jgi:hypothetical protein
MQCQRKLKPSRETAALQSEGLGTCFAGEREGERDGMGWVRLLGELDPDPGSESVPANKNVLGKLQSFGSVPIHLIRIQRLRLETNPDPDPIRIRSFNDQKSKKNYC